MWLGVFAIVIHCLRASTARECATDAQCSDLVPRSVCVDRHCLVEDSAQLRSRRALAYGTRMLGEQCEWTNQCRRTPIDGTKVCMAGQCQCVLGFVPIDAYRCVLDLEPKPTNTRVAKSSDSEPPGYGSTCSVSSDCRQATDYLECIRGTCLCIEGHVPLGKYLCFNTRSSSEDTPLVFADMLSTTTSYPLPNNPALKSLGKLGNTCANDYFCRRTVPQSHCYNGKCTCVDGFLPFDLYTCMKQEETSTTSTAIPIDYKSLLGGKCAVKRNCHTFNAICLDSVCTCPQGHFAVDDWTCLEASDSSDEEPLESTSVITKTTALPTTSTSTTFRWWPWSPTPSPHQAALSSPNTFRARCLLNRQCASMDKNSHCTLFGRCICNQGYLLETTTRGQRCIPRIINEQDCD